MKLKPESITLNSYSVHKLAILLQKYIEMATILDKQGYAYSNRNYEILRLTDGMFEQLEQPNPLHETFAEMWKKKDAYTERKE